jgi:hypothetical protein
MKIIGQQIFRFVLFVLLQVFIFNQIEIGLGITLLLCPLYIMLMPFDTNIFVLMGLAFLMGLNVDIMSDTYGLHASSLLLFAYFRPIIFNFFSPRDGYDVLKSPTIFDMGQTWFLYTFGSLLLIYLTWFFIIEIFSFNKIIYLLQKIFLSLIFTYLLSLLLQVFLLRKTQKL